MSKNYDLFNKNQMKKFFKDLEFDVKNTILNNIEFECSKCKNKIVGKVGKNKCPKCGFITTISLDKK